MNTTRYIQALSSGLGIVALSILGACSGKDIPVRTSANPDGVTATILAYHDGILGTCAADLVLRAPGGAILLRTNLLRGRDSIEDVRLEFGALSFRDGVVQLTAQKIHYHGPESFYIPVRR